MEKDNINAEKTYRFNVLEPPKFVAINPELRGNFYAPKKEISLFDKIEILIKHIVGKYASR